MPRDYARPGFDTLSPVKILFLCTGNTCRSPMALGLARTRLGGRDVELLSAGILPSGYPATDEAIETMAERDIDISGHLSTNVRDALDPEPDLILAMAAQHVREAVSLRPSLWHKTFTLKELVRRTAQAGPRRSVEPLPAYLARCAEDRALKDLASLAGTADDIEDPIGQGIARYRKCASELEALLDELLPRLIP